MGCGQSNDYISIIYKIKEESKEVMSIKLDVNYILEHNMKKLYKGFRIILDGKIRISVNKKKFAIYYDLKWLEFSHFVKEIDYFTPYILGTFNGANPGNNNIILIRKSIHSDSAFCKMGKMLKNPKIYHIEWNDNKDNISRY